MEGRTDINKQDGAPELRARARLLYGVLIFAFLGLMTRLVFLQIIQGERYTFLSENNRVRIKRIPGTRGMVLDRQGQLLIDSRPSFDLLFVPGGGHGAGGAYGQRLLQDFFVHHLLGAEPPDWNKGGPLKDATSN